MLPTIAERRRFATMPAGERSQPMSHPTVTCRDQLSLPLFTAEVKEAAPR